MDEDQQRRQANEEKEQKKKEKTHQVNVIVSMIERTLTRGQKCDDPVVKHSLLVDKLLLVLDVGLSYLEMISDEVDEACQARVGRCANLVQCELLELMKWVRSPIYSPDHPIGHKLMAEAKQDFTERVE